uniref:Uncharacterized protein n=1 Tax=Oryza meridionalis TaxID=40149 RepID=A0A0E0FDN9_9ORYZ
MNVEAVASALCAADRDGFDVRTVVCSVQTYRGTVAAPMRPPSQAYTDDEKDIEVASPWRTGRPKGRKALPLLKRRAVGTWGTADTTTSWSPLIFGMHKRRCSSRVRK